MVDVDARSTARAFLDGPRRLHVLPKVIVSDRGTQFTSAFWRRVCRILDIEQHMSTAFQALRSARRTTIRTRDDRSPTTIDRRIDVDSRRSR